MPLFKFSHQARTIDEFAEQCLASGVTQVSILVEKKRNEPWWLLLLPDVHVGMDYIIARYTGSNAKGRKFKFAKLYAENAWLPDEAVTCAIDKIHEDRQKLRGLQSTYQFTISAGVPVYSHIGTLFSASPPL